MDPQPLQPPTPPTHWQPRGRNWALSLSFASMALALCTWLFIIENFRWTRGPSNAIIPMTVFVGAGAGISVALAIAALRARGAAVTATLALLCSLLLTGTLSLALWGIGR